MRKLNEQELALYKNQLVEFSKTALFKLFVEDVHEIFDTKSFGVLDDYPKDVGEVLERERLIGECRGIRAISDWFASLEEQINEQLDEMEQSV